MLGVIKLKKRNKYGNQRTLSHGSERWRKKPPVEPGWYWHWNGDNDCCPVPMSILFSDGRPFITIGQLGITQPQWCDEYGGWWMRIREPATPCDRGRGL